MASHEESVIDLSNGQGKLIKKVINHAPSQTPDDNQSTPRRPEKGDRCFVHYVGTLHATGEKFDSSRDRGEPLEFKLGAGQVIQGWDDGVASMAVGEKALLTCAPDYAYGSSGAPPKIGPNETLDFEVELVDVIEGLERPAKRLEVVERCRAKGNEMFKSGSYAQAFMEYDEGLETLEKMEGIDREDVVEKENGLDWKTVRELRCALYSNAVFALQKDGKFDRGISFGRRGVGVVERIGGSRTVWAKLLYRIGCCEMECHMYDEGIRDLNEALGVVRSGSEADVKMEGQIKRDLANAKKKKVKSEVDEKKMYGKMFG